MKITTKKKEQNLLYLIKKVKPLIRKEIAENMRARYVPNIRFAYDTSQ